MPFISAMLSLKDQKQCGCQARRRSDMTVSSTRGWICRFLNCSSWLLFFKFYHVHVEAILTRTWTVWSGLSQHGSKASSGPGGRGGGGAGGRRGRGGGGGGARPLG